MIYRNKSLTLHWKLKTVVDILQQQEYIQIDELYFKSGLSSSAVAAALLMLEMQGVVASMPGKLYKLI